MVARSAWRAARLSTADAPPPTIAPAQAAAVSRRSRSDRPRAWCGRWPARAQAAVFDAAHVVAGGAQRPAPAVSRRSRRARRPAPPRPVPLPAAGDGAWPVTATARCTRRPAAATSASTSRAGRRRGWTSTGERDTDFTAITRRADGKLVLGSADGAVYTLGSEHRRSPPAEDLRAGGCPCRTRQYSRRAGPRPDVGDHRSTASGNDAEHALRAGEGATTMAADPAGRVLVADTRGDELLVFGTDPLILRQRYPVPGAPVRAGRLVAAGVGVADGDQHRRWLRSGHRNTRREGALSNRAATQLPGLRRQHWHPVRGVRLGSGRAGDRDAGAAAE